MHRTFILPRHSKLNRSTQQGVQLSCFPLYFGMCWNIHISISASWCDGELECRRVGYRRVELKRWVDKLSKSTYPSLAPITVFVISSLQSVTYWKNFCHMWWVSYGLNVINCICTLMRAVFWHTCTFSGYINRLCRYTVELDCVSWIHVR